MTRKINTSGLEALKRWEGLRHKAYKDSAGVWTIGYGHTSAAGAPKVHAGMTITTQQAENILRRDLAQYEQAVETAVKVSLTDNQFAALVSFVFNIGTERFRVSTLLKKLNAGQYSAVPSELMKWVKAWNLKTGKKETVGGLVNRRSAEAGLWAKGDFVSSGYIEPEAYKETAFLKPEIAGPVIGAAAGLTGFVTGSGPFQWALAIVMVIACLVGAWYFICRVKREAL